MTAGERREGTGRRTEDGHCGNHEEQAATIVSLKTERRVWASVLGIFIALVVYVYNNNSSSISSDLKDIKAFMVLARDNDAALKGELENIKWRLKALEDRK